MSYEGHMDAWLARDQQHKSATRANEKLIDMLIKERDALRAKLDALTAYIESKHNGYLNPGEPGMPEKAPTDHLTALRELIEEQEFMEGSLAKEAWDKLDAIHRWVADHADVEDSDPEHPPCPNEAAEIWQEFFDGKEPDHD